MTTEGRKVYICTDHDGHYPVGVASVVVAWNETHARQLLDESLIQNGLKPYADHPYTLTALDLHTSYAGVLRNGDY
jgi:hypothetical protein